MEGNKTKELNYLFILKTQYDFLCFINPSIGTRYEFYKFETVLLASVKEYTSSHFLINPHKDMFSLSLGKATPHIFSKFNPLTTDTLSTGRLSLVPSVSVLMAFDCI